jgi:hypothetical protein
MKQTKIIQAIYKFKKNNIFKFDKILNKIFQIFVNNQSTIFIYLFDIYYRFEIYFITFKYIITIILYKYKKIILIL